MPQPTRSYGRFNGQVALVTGAGCAKGEIGVGRAIAMAFAAEGARVGVFDRDGAAAEETKSIIESAGGEAFVLVGDASIEADVAACVQTALKTAARIDILINNVGISSGGGAFDQADMGEWARVFDINIKSAVLMTRHVLPSMIEHGGGSITNISSIAGMRAHGAPAYGPSKAAMNAFAREIATLYGRQGVRANTIAPGHIWTPMAQTAAGKAMRETRRKVAPLGVEGDAWDIANAALFLASEEARFITGVELPVDGGATIVPGIVGHRLAQTPE
jgi:NAD(P)-dependent dehydrogenase (short-subunit alcohol dehydrogenase family)